MQTSTKNARLRARGVISADTTCPVFPPRKYFSHFTDNEDLSCKSATKNEVTNDDIALNPSSNDQLLSRLGRHHPKSLLTPQILGPRRLTACRAPQHEDRPVHSLISTAGADHSSAHRLLRPQKVRR